MFKEALDASEVTLSDKTPLPAGIFDHPSIGYLSRHRLHRHYSIQSSGAIRASTSATHPTLTTSLPSGTCAQPTYRSCLWTSLTLTVTRTRLKYGRNACADMLSRRWHREETQYAIWRRRLRPDDTGAAQALRATFGQDLYTICGVDDILWNGLNLQPPMMHFGEVASLGVIVTEGDKLRVSFGLNDRPYASDVWYHTQKSVASVSFSGGLYGRDDLTLEPPYIPELNEFYARAMHFPSNRLRIESERIGLVVDATDTDSFVYALPTAELFKRVFAIAGFKASVSSGGLITRQLLSQLGGLQGARVFKVPGARRLLKAYGPNVNILQKSGAATYRCEGS